MLLEYGADINSQDCDGDTLLHIVGEDNDSHAGLYTMQHDVRNVKFLLDNCHADYLSIRNKDGETSWDIGYRRYDAVYTVLKRKRIQQIYSSLLFWNLPIEVVHH
jgi:hypothetical protein